MKIKKEVSIMINKKGQAAMEFLMTYGWALLVVLVAIGALAFFGVLNPGQFLPDACTMPPGISCSETLASGSSDDITLVMTNGMGNTLTHTSIVDLTLSGGSGCTIDTPIATWGSGETVSPVFDCGSGTLVSGSTVQGEVTFTYTLAGSTLAHTKTGRIALKVE